MLSKDIFFSCHSEICTKRTRVNIWRFRSFRYNPSLGSFTNDVKPQPQSLSISHSWQTNKTKNSCHFNFEKTRHLLYSKRSLQFTAELFHCMLAELNSWLIHYILLLFCNFRTLPPINSQKKHSPDHSVSSYPETRSVCLDSCQRIL